MQHASLLSDLERWDARCPIFQAGPLNNAHTILPRMTKFGSMAHVGLGGAYI